MDNYLGFCKFIEAIFRFPHELWIWGDLIWAYYSPFPIKREQQIKIAELLVYAMNILRSNAPMEETYAMP